MPAKYAKNAKGTKSQRFLGSVLIFAFFAYFAGKIFKVGGPGAPV